MNADDPQRPPPRPTPWWRRRLLDALIIGGLFVGINAWQTRHLVGRGELAPALALTTAQGAAVSLEALRGKRVQLHFWATWCGVCKLEYGALNAIHEGLGPDEALVTVVADGDDPERVRAYLAEHDIRYPVWLGQPDALRAFRVDRFPTNYYVDPQGRMASADAGWSTRWGMAVRRGCAGGE